MEEYYNLTDPLVNGVFVADAKAGTVVVNPYLELMQNMSEYISSLRQQQFLELPQQQDNTRDNTRNYSEDMGLSFIELLKLEGLNVTVTSTYRPGAKTKQGKTSHHSRKDEWGNSMAIDFRAADGNTDKLLHDIYNNPRICAWLRNHGRGIIEETNAHPDIRRSTGADKTAKGGDLLHMGPDRLAIRMSSNWMSYDNPYKAVSPTLTITPSSKNAGKSGRERLKYVKNYIMQNFGLDAIHASALAGVWFAESRLEPSIKSKIDSGTGIVQWTGSRHLEFNKFYRQVFGRQSPGIRNTSLEEQIHVAIAEYKARTGNWNHFLRRTDLLGATDSVLRGYENGGSNKLATISDIDRIYTKNGSGSYRKLMADRLSYARQALN